MPLIEREVKETTVRVTFSLETSLSERLKEYAEYLESTQNHIVSECLKYVIDRDKEFAARAAVSSSSSAHTNGRAVKQIDKQKSVVA